jgi:hypothetical protein
MAVSKEVGDLVGVRTMITLRGGFCGSSKIILADKNTFCQNCGNAIKKEEKVVMAAPGRCGWGFVCCDCTFPTSLLSGNTKDLWGRINQYLGKQDVQR